MATLRSLAELGDHRKQIVCDHCKQTKGASGAKPFHKLLICAECTKRLMSLKPPEKEKT